MTGLEWKIGPDGKPHFVYPDDEPPPAGIDLDKAEADLFQRIQLAHAIPGEHGHPGGMGFEQKVVPQRQDLIINEGDATEGVKFPMPIRGGGDGKEHPMIAPQTTPDTPDLGILAQKGVDYTSPHPKFDAHMKNTPPMNKPDERIKHLNEGVKIRKA